MLLLIFIYIYICFISGTEGLQQFQKAVGSQGSGVVQPHFCKSKQTQCSFLRSSSFPSFCNFDNFLSTASCGDKEAGSEVHWERDMRGEDWDWALWRPLCRLLVLSNCQDDKKQRLWATTDFITTTAPRSSLVPDTNEPLLADCSSSVDGERKCA